jgi:hypothetical protein
MAGSSGRCLSSASDSRLPPPPINKVETLFIKDEYRRFFINADAIIYIPPSPPPPRGEGKGGGDVHLFISYVLVVCYGESIKKVNDQVKEKNESPRGR